MRRRKLLLIDPGAERREAIQRAFIAGGWEVAMAATQAEGLRLLDDYFPQWVVVAASLPDGDGGAVLNRVRASRRARVAVLSGVVDDARLAEIAGWRPTLLAGEPLDTADLYRRCTGHGMSRSALG
jgi:DNA-binding response OmpR family regulator